MSAHEADVEARRMAVGYAESVLRGRLGILEGCVALADIAGRVVPSWCDDSDFAIIGSIASECDGIPLGNARHQWKGAALERMDAAAQKYTDQVRDVVVSACENIVARFGNRDEDQLPGSAV
jgi:hypothetical protein